MTNNLENVKQGDTVLVKGRYCDRLLTVDRVTKTQVIANNSRYRKSDGSNIGCGHWDYAIMYAVTDEEIKDFKRKAAESKEHSNLVSQYREIDYHNLSSDQLRRIIEISKENK